MSVRFIDKGGQKVRLNLVVLKQLFECGGCGRSNKSNRYITFTLRPNTRECFEIPWDCEQCVEDFPGNVKTEVITSFTIKMFSHCYPPDEIYY